MMTEMWDNVMVCESRNEKRSLTERTFPYQAQDQLHKGCMFVRCLYYICV